MPACALTTSASAQKATPSPYARQCPWRQVTISGSESTSRLSSYTSRLFPIPGTATSVTNCGIRSWRARSKLSRRIESSRSRPTSSVRAWWVSSTPKRERAAVASQTAIGSALAFRVDRSGSAVIDDPPCRAVGRLVGEDPVHGGGALQAGSSVDDVPGGHGLPLGGARSEGDENLSCRDADAQLESLIEREVADRQRCTNSTLRIVVVCRRSAEESHHRVSDELLDRAAVALQLRAHALVVRAEDRSHVLRIELLGLRSEADQVAEDHGDDLALLARERRVGVSRVPHIPHSRKPSGFS